MSDFKYSLKLKIYSQDLYVTPAVVQVLVSGREEAVVCPGPGGTPAVFIWKQFDP